MKHALPLLACAAMIGPPAAASSPTEILLSCQIENSHKHLILAAHENTLTYRFGPLAEPELTLTQNKADTSNTPWNGVGRAIWESLDFQNGHITYTVFGSIDKILAIEDPSTAFSGGVEVWKSGDVIATFFCAPETVSYQAFAFADALAPTE